VALADYLDSVSNTDLTVILRCMEDIIRNNLQNDRVVIPALETLAELLEEDIFSRIVESYKFVSRSFKAD